MENGGLFSRDSILEHLYFGKSRTSGQLQYHSLVMFRSFLFFLFVYSFSSFISSGNVLLWTVALVFPVIGLEVDLKDTISQSVTVQGLNRD